MTIIRHTLCVALVLGLSASPASAQAPDWIHDLADEVAREARELARFVEQQVTAAQNRRDTRGRQPRGPAVTEAFARTVRLGRNGSVDLRNFSGDIVIMGTGGNDVRIEATKRVTHPDEAEARALLKEMEIRVVERGGAVEVRAETPRRRNWPAAIDFSVSVPRDATVTVQNVAGSIRVSSLNGGLRADSVSGDVVVSEAQAVRQAKTVSGNLDLSNVRGDDVNVASVSGRIRIDSLGARSLTAQSVSGDLRLSGIETDRASARSVSGDIDFAGRLSRNGRYEFQSHSGDARIAPAGDRGFALEATTFSGSVSSDYPLTLQSTPNRGFAPGRRNNALRGSFGDAGATLSIQSFSGNIVIVK